MQFLSGTFGTPISMGVQNEDQRSEAYSEMAPKFRPSHANDPFQTESGVRAWSGKDGKTTMVNQ